MIFLGKIETYRTFFNTAAAFCRGGIFVQTYQKTHKIFYLQKLRIAYKMYSRVRENLLLFLGISAGNSNTLIQRKFLQELVKHDIIKEEECR